MTITRTSTNPDAKVIWAVEDDDAHQAILRSVLKGLDAHFSIFQKPTDIISALAAAKASGARMPDMIVADVGFADDIPGANPNTSKMEPLESANYIIGKIREHSDAPILLYTGHKELEEYADPARGVTSQIKNGKIHELTQAIAAPMGASPVSLRNR